MTTIHYPAKPYSDLKRAQLVQLAYALEDQRDRALRRLESIEGKPGVDWADIRETARKHEWTRRTEPAGWRPVESDVWGHYPPGEKFIDGEQGWVRVGLRGYVLVIELTGPPIRITELGGEVRRDVKLVDPTPAEVLAAARLVGLDGARS